jgi:hypothetical protein
MQVTAGEFDALVEDPAATLLRRGLVFGNARCSASV